MRITMLQLADKVRPGGEIKHRAGHRNIFRQKIQRERPEIGTWRVDTLPARDLVVEQLHLHAGARRIAVLNPVRLEYRRQQQPRFFAYHYTPCYALARQLICSVCKILNIFII